MSIFSPKYLVKIYKVWLLTKSRTQTNCERRKYHVLCISLSPWVIQYHCWGLFLHMQAESAETLAKRIKLADAIKRPPPGYRHVYQRKAKCKPGSGLSIKPVYFLNLHTCHVFCLISLPKFRNTKLFFFLHSSYTKILLFSLSNTNLYFLPFYHPDAKLAGTCMAHVCGRKNLRPLHTLAAATQTAR